MNEIFTSLKRTPYQTFAALSVLFFTLLLSGLLFISMTFLQGLLDYVETRPRVIVYFQVKAEDAQIQAVQALLKNSGKTAEITYVSKEKAFEIYKEFTENDPLLLEMTSADILPASLEIDAKKPEFLQEIADMIANQPGVDEVQFQKDIINNLLSITMSVRKFTLIFFGYLMFMSIIVLTTTLSFKIALKREEIGILQLLGATKMYIRKPFIGESIMLGIIATTLANSLLIVVLVMLNTFLSSYFSGVESLNMTLGVFELQVWPFTMTFGILTLAVTAIFSLAITLISSFAATNRYLK
ncbi:permease-like cell division protein FtsX [Candidatus Woesebacteria bacterium]|nr:permease-like cell division protein FtsX [Candidatus Woesebacteria bacterium]